ncbi:MAG: hypothetical protein ACP5P1_15555 [Acidimicrobiales bacterium]
MTSVEFTASLIVVSVTLRSSRLRVRTAGSRPPAVMTAVRDDRGGGISMWGSGRSSCAAGYVDWPVPIMGW